MEAARERLPPDLRDLADVAVDLRWTGSHFANRVWELLDAEAWDRSKNAITILRNAHQDRIDAVFADPEMHAATRDWLDRRRRHLEEPGWFEREHGSAGLSGVAYFSMEFGLSEALPIHSGGLGILAGDHLKSASDLGVPVTGIGLLYQQGYFRQVIASDGTQLEALPFNEPGSMPVRPAAGPDGRWPRVRIPLPGRTLFVRVWEAVVGRNRLYLLDTNDALNNPWDRAITSTLYAAGRENRLLQEIVLGVGGWQLVRKLGLHADVCHLNEGHAAFAVLARAGDFAAEHGVPFDVALRATRAGNVFTTHTLLPAAFDRFEPDLIETYAKPFLDAVGLPPERLLAMGRRNPGDDGEPFNMAYLAMRGCGRVNAVSRLHARVSRKLFHVLFPGRAEADVPVGFVTNGVHTPTWDSAPANEFWTRAYPEGRWLDHIEEAAARIAELPPEDLWRFRVEAREGLVRYVRRRYARQLRENGMPETLVERARHALDPNALTLGFARRFTAYKRPTLVLREPERLVALLRDRTRPVQLIVAGKAHPNDREGKLLVRELARFAQRDDVFDRMVYLQDYDIALAAQLVGGVDVWLNTPRRPNEACGTSGMKILVNGGLHLSTLDGWWDEAYDPEVGWAIGGGAEHEGERDAEEAAETYRILEQEIVPGFYDRDGEGVPQAWIRRVRSSMSRLAPRFSANRMVREYVEKAYLPAAAGYRDRSAERAAKALDLERWNARLSDDWRDLRFLDVRSENVGDRWRILANVYLGDLASDIVRVELYSDHNGGEVYEMERNGPLPGVVNGFRYAASVPADRPPHHYTPRVVPFHESALLPIEASQVLWQR